MKFGLIIAISLLTIGAAAQKPELREQTLIPFGYGDFFEVGEVKGKIAPAKAIILPKPVYPDRARRTGAEGKVRVDIVISTDGTVASANSVSGDPELRTASESAARQAKFLPVESEIRGHLTYEFIIAAPNWFAVAFDLYAIDAANPAIIRKAIPEDWLEEYRLASRLVELGQTPLRPTLAAPRTSTSGNRASSQMAVVVPIPLELSAIADELRLRLRSRLRGGDLREFELGEAMVEALIAFRNPAMQAFSTGLISPFASLPPDELAVNWTGRLREFLQSERNYSPSEYQSRLRAMAMEFRSRRQE